MAASHHVALRTPDILSEIFDYIEQEISLNTFSVETLKTNNYSEARRTLADAALTCRSFLSPALDALWKRLSSLIPLLSLLNAFRKVGTVYVLEGNISAHESARFDFYACRVREIRYPGFDGGSDDPFVYFQAMRNPTRSHRLIDPSVFLRLAQIGRSPLLPCLRVIRWDDIYPPNSEFFLLVASTLVLLDISIHKDLSEPEEAAIVTLFNTVARDAPSLKYFSAPGKLSQYCLSSIKNFQNLRGLTIKGSGGITHKTSQAFSEMPHLVQLEVSVASQDTSSMLPRMEFKSLEELFLTGPLVAVTYILDTLDALHLESLTVDGSRAQRKEDYQSFFARIQFASLRTVEICIMETEDLEDTLGFELKGCDIIRPLQSLIELEYLTIDVESRSIAIADEDISSMAMAWPKIKTLCLQHKPASNRLPSIESLISFVHHCPALVQLHLPMTADTANLSEVPIFSHNLKLIDFRNWSCPAPRAAEVAYFLHCLFPTLDMQQVYRSVAAQGKYGWREIVVDILQEHQRFRENSQLVERASCTVIPD